jgi:endonuclease-8
MPEGNETHRWAELHTKMFGGKKVNVDSPQGRFTDAGVVDGRVLEGVLAVGKHLGYDFGIVRKQRCIVHVHMGLYGDFTEGEGKLPEPRGALRMRLWTRTDWLELRGPTDCRVFNEAQWQALLNRLGPDPLNARGKAGDGPDRMIERIARRKTAIGALLMDQSIVSGLGNIYRAELLFRASVSPFRAGAAVPAETLKAIWRDAVKLMPDAMVDRRIVTTKPADRPHRKELLNEEAHYVYRRKGLPCFLCGTAIETKVMAGRNLFWCPHCQAE